MSIVITLNGELINLGEWDYKIVQEPVINNPFPGPLEAPEDWDYQITYIDVVTNPLPEGAITEDREVFFDDAGKLWLQDDAAKEAAEKLLAANKAELAELMQDILIGLATPEEIARAAELRTAIKAA